MCREAPAPIEAVGAKWLDGNRSRRTWEPDQHLVGDDAPTRRIPNWLIGAGKPERCQTAVWLNRHSWNRKPLLEAPDVIAVAPVRVHLTNRQRVVIFVRSSNAVHTHIGNSDVPT